MVEIHIPEPVFTIDSWYEGRTAAGAHIAQVRIRCGDTEVYARTYDITADSDSEYADWDMDECRKDALTAFGKKIATLVAIETTTARPIDPMPVNKTTLRWPDGPNELREHMLQSHGYEYLSFFNSAVVDSATRRHFEAHADSTAASLDHTHEARS